MTANSNAEVQQGILPDAGPRGSEYSGITLHQQRFTRYLTCL